MLISANHLIAGFRVFTICDWHVPLTAAPHFIYPHSEFRILIVGPLNLGSRTLLLSIGALLFHRAWDIVTRPVILLRIVPKVVMN